MKRFVLVFLICLVCALSGFCSESKNTFEQDIHELVKLYYSTGKTAQCVEELTKIPDTQKTAQEWVIMANLAQDRQKPLDAVFFLQRAVIADPKFYKAYYNLGNVYFDNDNTSLAMENFKKVIKLKSDFAYAYYNLGCCYLKKGNYRLARYYFANAIKYKEDDPAFYYNLAYTYKMLKKKKRAQDALDIYEELMSK